MQTASIEAGEYLSGRLSEQIDYHDRKAVSSQHAYRKLIVISVATTSLTPLLLALEMLYSPPPLSSPTQLVVEVLPVVVATIAAISTVSLSAFKFKESWVEHRMACEALQREGMLYKYRVGPYADAPDPCALLVERAETIMDGDARSWRGFVESSASPTHGAS